MVFSQLQRDALSEGIYDGIRYSALPTSDLLLKNDLGVHYASGYVIGRAAYLRGRMVQEYVGGGIICILGVIICVFSGLSVGVLLFTAAGGFIAFNWNKNKPTLPNPPKWFLERCGVNSTFLSKLLSSQELKEALVIGRVEKISDDISTKDFEAISRDRFV